MTPQFPRAEIPAAPHLQFEQSLWADGFNCLGGLDEAGRGAWAGPVAAAVVILPVDVGILERLAGVRDSKLMTPAQRTFWAARIRSEALETGVGYASAAEIDRLGILPATRLAMQRALGHLHCTPQHLLIDALRLPAVPTAQTALIKGDARSLSIAAASVLAKTGRDAWMRAAERDCPGYGFAQHKGYGTAVHQAALRQLGISSIHRRSFAPVARHLSLIPCGDDSD